MANEIIKVYDTEVNAIANGTTGLIDPVAAISGHSGIIANVAAEDIPFYIYKKFYYRFEANEPVTEFHIDWDDGEDNSPEKANIEIIKLSNPDFSIITSHIYTEHKHFFPLIRVKNIEGYLSKWYTNDSSLNDFSGLETKSLPPNQQGISIVSTEKINTDRIGSFLPANLPPIGNLKADKKRIYSGIDNDTIKSTYTYPLLYAYSTSTVSSKPDIKFTLQDNKGAIKEHTMSGTQVWNAGSAWVSMGANQNSDNAIPNGNYHTATQQESYRLTFKDAVDSSPTHATDVTKISWTTLNDYWLDIWYDNGNKEDVAGGPGVPYTDKQNQAGVRIFFLDGGSHGPISSNRDPHGDPIDEENMSTFKVEIPGSTDADTFTAQTLCQAFKTAIDDHNSDNVSSDIMMPLTTGSVTASGNDYYVDITREVVGPTTDWSVVGISSSYVTFTKLQDGAGTIHTTESAKKLLRVELDNATELADDDKIYIKVFDVGDDKNLLASETANNTLAVLSNGSPIVEIDDGNTVYLDGTESFTRASNLSISTYNFDEDKLNNSGAVQATDVDAVSDLMSGTFNSTGSKELSYSFNNVGDSVDSDGRFYPTYRLTRLQVKDNMTNTTYHNAEATITITDYTQLNTGDKVNLIATDGTDYDFTVGDQSSVAGTWEAATSNNATATNLMNVINTSSGPSGTRFTATVFGAVVTATQATAGSAGSTTVTLTDTGTAGMTKTNFTIRALDTLTYSTIEHFDDTSYTAAAVEMPSDLESKGLLLYSNKDAVPGVAGETGATWSDVSTRNIDSTVEIFGGSSSYQLRDSTNLTDHPRNHLFIAQTEKFDRLFFRMNNTNTIAETYWPPSVAITAYYANGTTWEPLEIIDETQGLQVSGSIKFNMPHDWYNGQYTHVDGGTWNGPVDEQGDTSAAAPGDLWRFNAYGFLICFIVKGTSNNETKIKCANVWPYNNSHSQLIKIEDPHYVSLNSIAIAQSISFGRSSKVISVEDKFGKADIRKIGAGGGSVRFGGIDLGGSVDDRKTIVGYQKNATPVYLDIEHKSGEKTRFHGVISQVTEDHPAGKMIPKWAVTMNIAHVLDLSSTGAVDSDMISIGGALVDDGKYLL